MKTIPTLFVAFSHTLTPSQIEGFKTQFASDEEATIVTLAEVAPELQAQMSQIPATASLVEIQELAKAIVAEAVKCGATHFFCTGEPTLTMWANIYASSEFEYFNYLLQEWVVYGDVYHPMVCIQSTTERKTVEVTNPDGTVTKTQIFSHVQWRKMF